MTVDNFKKEKKKEMESERENIYNNNNNNNNNITYKDTHARAFTQVLLASNFNPAGVITTITIIIIVIT